MKKTILLLLSMVMFAGIVRANHWNVENQNQYQGYTIVQAVVQIDGIEQTSTTLELGAFCGEVVRGSKYAQMAPGGRYVFRLSCYGGPGDVFSFRLYDSALDKELNDKVCDVTLAYRQEAYGSGSNPYVLPFNTTASSYTLDIAGYGAGNAGGYHLIASPVTEAITPSTENGFITDAFDLYYFDQNGDGGTPNNEWINYELQGGGYATWKITSGKGYLYASQTDTQLQFAGTACTDGNVPLEYSTTNPSTFIHGWNLIGNPLAEDATISQACYVMNENGTELEAAASGKLIPAMNGVFVKAEGAGESVTFTPSNNSGEGAKIDINVLKDRGATIDRAIVCLGEGGTLPKFMLNPENTKIYIEQGGDDYAVVSSNEDEIPVSFKAASNGTYTLNVAVQNAEMDYLHLIDNLAGTDTDLLANPSYTFEANTGDYASRFTLVLRNTTGLVEHFAFFNGHNWTVSNQGEATLQVIDVTGRVVSTKTIDGTTQLDVNAAPGVYMFRLVNGNDVKVQKVVVR